MHRKRVAILPVHRPRGTDRTDPSSLKAPVSWPDSPKKNCVTANTTLKKPFNQMKSETNIGIKSYRNAEVNGMEYNPCKNVEVLGNKGPSRSYMIKCEMCIW